MAIDKPWKHLMEQRRRLSKTFIQGLADDFAIHGVATIQAFRQSDPAGYIKAVAALLPKDPVDVKHSGTLAVESIPVQETVTWLDGLGGRGEEGASEKPVLN